MCNKNNDDDVVAERERERRKKERARGKKVQTRKISITKFILKNTRGGLQQKAFNYPLESSRDS